MISLVTHFFRILCCTFSYNKLLKINSNKLPSTYTNIFVLSILYLASIFFHYIFPQSSSIIFGILFACSMYYIHRTKMDLCLTISVISLALYHIVYFFCTLIVTIFFSPFYYYNNHIPINLFAAIASILTMVATYLLFRIKRFKTGMPFLTTINFIHFGILASIYILALKILDQTNTSPSNLAEDLIPLIVFLLAFQLFTWWQKQITKSYVEKLRNLEIQSLYDELAEKDRLIEILTSDNDELARIVHKDNKLIPAMENAVSDFLSFDYNTDVNLLKQYGTMLATQLHALSQNRKGILSSYREHDIHWSPTGYIRIDAVLAYMQKKADANHISFQCKYTKDNLTYLLEHISEDDLSHLLSDLLENAIIAMIGHDTGKLQVTFGKYQNEAYFSIADTGNTFDIRTLHNLGLQPHTTHADENGSGIGWMDIWKIKKKYRCSLQIQEYSLHEDNFTKKIILSFNNKNHYVIQSHRHKEITNTLIRGDLYVIPSEKSSENGGKSA